MVYEAVALPKIWTKIFEKFCPDTIGQNFSIFFVNILGNAMTSYVHSGFSWPLWWLSWLPKKYNNCNQIWDKEHFFRTLCSLYKPNSTQFTSKCMTTFKQPRQVLCCTISNFRAKWWNLQLLFLNSIYSRTSNTINKHQNVDLKTCFFFAYLFFSTLKLWS